MSPDTVNRNSEFTGDTPQQPSTLAAANSALAGLQADRAQLVDNGRHPSTLAKLLRGRLPANFP
jgi:hypothetical protein